MADALEWYKEAERRGLINQLSKEQQAWWAEAKRRGLDKESNPASQRTEEPELKPVERIQGVDYSTGPNAFQGGYANLVNELTYGAGPYIAGATNIQARRFGDVVGGIIDGDMKRIAQGVFPSSEKIQQYKEEGQKEFIESQKKFAEEHPKTKAVTGFVGELGSFVPATRVAGVLGKATQLLRLGARARASGIVGRGVAQAIRTGAPRAVTGAGAFGLQGGTEGLMNEGEGLSPEKGWQELKENALLGAAFTMIGGAVGTYVEQPLLKSAAEMSGIKGFAKKASVVTGAAALEGAAVATVAAGIEKAMGEDRSIVPSLGEIGATTAVIGGFRGAGKGAEALGKGWKALSGASKKELADMKKAGVQYTIDDAMNEVQAAKQSYKKIKTERTSIKEAREKIPTIDEEISRLNESVRVLEEDNKFAEINKTPFSEEKPIQANTPEGRAQLFDNTETLAKDIADRAGLKTRSVEQDTVSNKSDSRYFDVGTGKNRTRVRIADHELQGGNYDVWLNPNASPKENAQKLIKFLEEKNNRIVKEGKDKISQLAAEREDLIRRSGGATELEWASRNQELKIQQQQKAKDFRDASKKLKQAKELAKEEPIQISISEDVSPEEIAERRKMYPSSQVGDTELKQLIVKERRNAAIENLKSQKEKLPFGERVRRLLSVGVRKVENALNMYAPLNRTVINGVKITGEKMPSVGEMPAFTSSQRDRGGRIELRQRKVGDKVLAETKKDNTFHERYDNYLENKKNEDMLPGEINRAKLEGDMERASRLEKKLAEAKQASSETEKSSPRIVELAEETWAENRAALDEIYESGRISKDYYEQLKKNKHYVHTEIERDNIFTGEEADMLNKQSGLSSAFKKYGAYEGQRKPLLLSSLAQGRRFAWFADTQKAMKQWLKWGLKTGEAIPAQDIRYQEGKMPQGVNLDKQIVVWNNGVARVYDVPKDVAMAFNYRPPEENKILGALRLTNNQFKMLTTGISSGFAAMNLFRDFQGILGGSRSGMYLKPSYVELAGELYGPGPKNLSGAKKQLRDLIDSKLGTESTLADTEMQLDRSQVARVSSMLDASREGNKPGTFVGDMMSFFWKMLSKVPAERPFQAIAKPLSALSNWSEKTGRASVFLSELRRQAGSERAFNRMLEHPETITKAQADNAAKEMAEVTLDFPRKMSPTIEFLNRNLLPFFKPSLLGAERLSKVLTDPEISPQAWRWLGTVGAMQGAIRAEFDEGQRKKYESQLNPEISAKSVSFVNKDGMITTIPAQQEFGGLYQGIAALTEMLMRNIKGKDQREAIWDELKAAAGQFRNNAVPGGYLFEPSNIVPTPIGKMIVEEKINKDIYSNTEIESAAMRRLPVEERFSADTPRIYRLMSKYIKLGDLQSSPKMWEHRAKKLGSTFAKEMADVADVLLEYAGIGEEEWSLPKNVDDSSIVKRFFNKDYTAYARNVQEYDKEKKELEQAYNSYKKNPKAADKEKKDKAAIYHALNKREAKRIELISYNQKLLANLRRKGYSEWERYTKNEITKEQFNKSKEIESAKTAAKYYENQKKISDLTDKLLTELRAQKKKKGIK